METPDGAFWKETSFVLLNIHTTFDQMAQHEDFLAGFGDVLGLSDPAEVLFHYQRWIRESDLSIIEIIDLESPGYQAGLEVGNIYKEENL